MRGRVIVVALLATACSTDGTSTSGSQPIVGGSPESGYPASGWLGLASGGQPFCGATLIAPGTALTAAHCVTWVTASTPIVFSHGVVGEEPRYDVTTVYIHPSYDPNRPGWTFTYHDLAILPLATDVVGVAPATIGRAYWVPTEPERTAILVGYGRTAGNDPATGDRRSAHYRINGMKRQFIDASSIDGGACFGDSGSALWWPDSDELLGAVSAGSGCDVYNWVRFVNLIEERGFICGGAPEATTVEGSCAELCAAGLDCTLSCAADGVCVDWCEPDPDCCIDDGACHLACTTEPDCCQQDGECNEDCSPDDPDCPCGADGGCTVACESDPDCGPPPDAGVDAPPIDAGVIVDAGTISPDAGTVPPDAATPIDAGLTPDAADAPAADDGADRSDDGGCLAASSRPPSPWLLLLAVAFLRRARHRHRPTSE